MGTKLPPQELQFYNFIHQTLWEKWDPIGVRELDGPEDEYDSYLPEIYQLLRRGESLETVSEFLLAIERDSMGLNGDMDHCRKVVQLLFSKQAEIFGDS